MILYLTYDGLLEPLGRSQIVKPLLRLAARGFSIGVVSLEKPSTLGERARLLELRASLADAGIRWCHAVYDTSGGGRSVVRNLRRLYDVAARVCRVAPPRVIHARSYPPAVVGTRLAKRFSARFIFDIRGYWVDERRDEGRWFHTAPAYRIAKEVERSLFAHADGIVSLTSLSGADIRAGRLGPVRRGVPIEVIPTVADFEEFTSSAEQSRVHEIAGGRRVVCFSGAVRAACDLDGLAAFLRAASKREDVFVLALTRQEAEMRRLLDSASVQKSASLITSVPHEEVRYWLSGADFGLLFLRTTFANRAMMPTKLAEFLGSGMIPIQHGGNSEIGDLVRSAGGCALGSLESGALDSACAQLFGRAPSHEARQIARSAGRAHFDLEAGVERYAALWAQLC